ncbi:Rpn family recombination-promoting nuclease/putative transposase [Kineothrix sp. MSJ-39]|uniref:Rpn family recombination-promoting nuclease/putative transposase n=1 Tax=Kineothrix sp. MSJ-39 TaxID=2841533 RepID=UPI001C1055DD|nr:Rpn family recombination-promoting nuclease/putative transposase [Kineothrix sp. MSJ-39]MBU5429822.1 Rpn family recombination-promoting nuclease/putative transposase [Kineothrix sp. MSJ-39]
MTQRKVTPDKGTAKGKTEAINFDEIGITNDFMFGTVFRDKVKCKELLQRILKIKLTEIEVVEPQKMMKTTLIGKGIRIDVYAKDSEGNVYDIEMQTTEEIDLHLRTRYYHSEMDSYQIRAGQKYFNLKQSVVIFICTFDPFADDRSIYTFESVCKENKELVLADKRRTYFVNINGNREGISEDTTKLLDYFKTGQPTDRYTEDIQEQVQIIRNDDDWRENYMTIEMKMDQKYEQGKNEGIQLGRSEGEISKERELITKWLQKGKSLAEIAEDLDQSEEYVKSLICSQK